MLAVSCVTSYQSHLESLRSGEPALADELAGFDRVRKVLEWMRRRGLMQTAVDMVGQDEFHYDLLVPLADGRWLAFGVT